MSSIAEFLRDAGFAVQGSDTAEGYNIQRLRQLGIQVGLGHDPANLADAQTVVFSSAIHQDNPELISARMRSIPAIHRVDMLAELMQSKKSIVVGGTHGKTTTTSMIAALLEASGLAPTIITGGVMNAYNSGAKLGSGKWMVVESDESDGSFIKLPAEAVVVTNISKEHLSHYGSFENMQEAFKRFIENIPAHGFAVLCADHPVVQRLSTQIKDRRIVTYSLDRKAEVSCCDIVSGMGFSKFTVQISGYEDGQSITIPGLEIEALGRHNVSNACAAIAVAKQLGSSPDMILQGLKQFKGVRRRFTHTGTHNGIQVFDDYGHHPSEISAVLEAANAATGSKNKNGRLIAIVQPHRYSRVAGLFDEFCQAFGHADYVLVTDVYAAGEEAMSGISKYSLVKEMKDRGHLGGLVVEEMSDLPSMVFEIARPGDYVILFGAGDITEYAYKLPNQLASLSANGWKQKA